MKYTEEIEQAALTLVDNERTQWEDAVCWITEKVGFRMREMIRVFRKNYWGVYEKPQDGSGNEKIWMHLSLSTVEDLVKNTDIDLKDLNFRARTPKGIEFTHVIRGHVREQLEKIYFGETLDSMERQLAIDGTTVWKTWSENGKLRRSDVNLLNFYIDPTADSIQTTARVTERALVLPDNVRAMSGWSNTEDVCGSSNLSNNDPRITSGQNLTKYVDVWETWGLIPSWFFAKNKTEAKKLRNTGEMIEGHIVVSGLQGGKKNVHLIEKNTKKDKEGNALRPYEEARPARVIGRWYGLGMIERIMALQEYMNLTINMRKNKAKVSQLGLFKVRKGSGVTTQMLKKLLSNGAIEVTNMADVEQWQMSGHGADSYNDEEVIKAWASKITGTYPATTGESLPASQTATASAIQSNAGKSSYALYKEAVGMFLERWTDRQAMPIYAKQIKIGDMIRIQPDDSKYGEIITSVVGHLVGKKIEETHGSDRMITPQELEAMISDVEDKLRKNGSIFVEAMEEIAADSLETKISWTTQDLDTSVTVQNLLQLIPLAPEYREAFVRTSLDLMGLPIPAKPTPPVQPNSQQQSAGQPSQTPPTQEGIMQQANGIG